MQGDATYLEDARTDQTLTYADLWLSTQAWEQRLDRAGLPPRARVAIRMPDPVSYAAALVGVIGAGRVAVPLDPNAPAADLARVLAVARPAAVVSPDSASLPPGLEILRPPNAPGLSGSEAGSPAGEPAQTAAPASGGIFLCTSGTTGTPKGILLGDAQLAHVAATVAKLHRLTTDDRGYCSLPLFHVNAEVVGLLATLSAQACLVLDRKFSRRGFWGMIKDREITWINAVPAIISILGMDPSAGPAPRRVRFVRSASAPLPRPALEQFESAFGLPVIETYGMTEAASMIAANPIDGPRKAGSVGRSAGTEVRIVRPTGTGHVPCPAFETGRVQIRGAGVISRYAEGGKPGVIDRDGWLDTSDLGYLDEDGYLFLAGRSDDVINRGGEKIYPREIEEVIVAQPSVLSAAVVGVADEVLGERPVAYVVAEADADIEEAVRAACQDALPRHKQPSAFFLVDKLPLGPTGKIARHRLRELAARVA